MAIESWNEVIPVITKHYETKLNDATADDFEDTTSKLIPSSSVLSKVSPASTEDKSRKFERNHFKMLIYRKLAVAFIDQSDDLMQDLVE